MTVGTLPSNNISTRTAGTPLPDQAQKQVLGLARRRGQAAGRMISARYAPFIIEIKTSRYLAIMSKMVGA